MGTRVEHEYDSQGGIVARCALFGIATDVVSGTHPIGLGPSVAAAFLGLLDS